MSSATFRIWRGGSEGGEFKDYTTGVSEGMVVLDAVHQIQAEQANDLAVRWNCKAGKCGSCSAEVNGSPKLMCMTRLSSLPLERPVTIEPMQAFPAVRDLVTDVSWNYQVKKAIKPFAPREPDAPDGTWRMEQYDVERVQEFRKCIECFLCQDVCHVLRDHRLHGEFIGPRYFVHSARPRDAPPRHRRPHHRARRRPRRRLLQHHQVLHHGLPGRDHHHRQRDHSAEGARGGQDVRPADEAAADVQVVARVAGASKGVRFRGRDDGWDRSS